jgi:hypothetical protein
MFVHANHLKLPGMTALMSARELRQLRRRLSSSTATAVTSTHGAQTSFFDR